MKDPELWLVGATGYTGALVARRLAELGLPFTAVGRDPERLEAATAALGQRVRCVQADLSHPEDVARLARPGRVILSCVGPYSLYGRDLAEAAARSGSTYLDVCGEEPFVAWSQEELDGPARASGALLLHGCAFESLPAVLLAAQLVAEGTAATELASYYRVPGHAMSPGTRLTMRLASRWPTSRFEDGTFVATAPGGVRRNIDLPFLPGADIAVFAPYPEVRFWPAVHGPRAALSFLALSRGEAALVGSGGKTGRERPVEDVIARDARTRRPGPTSEERAGQRFVLGVVATDENDHRRAAVLTGVDPYGLTAVIAAWVAARLVARADPHDAVGVRAPSELVTADGFLEHARAWQPGLALTTTELP